MKNKIAVIIPTLKRLKDFIYFADSWKKTTEGLSDVIVGLDINDTTYDDIIKNNVYPEFIYERCQEKSCLGVLNELAVKYADEYICLSFLEDDCAFISNNWESTFLNVINKKGPTAIVWGSDLLNYDKVVGVPFVHSQLVKTLGYMSLPNFKSQYADVYWLQLGQGLNSLYYFHYTVIEHRHFITGKRQRDETALKGGVDSQGETEFYRSEEYRRLLNADIEKLRKFR